MAKSTKPESSTAVCVNMQIPRFHSRSTEENPRTRILTEPQMKNRYITEHIVRNCPIVSFFPSSICCISKCSDIFSLCAMIIIIIQTSKYSPTALHLLFVAIAPFHCSSPCTLGQHLPQTVISQKHTRKWQNVVWIY